MKGKNLYSRMRRELSIAHIAFDRHTLSSLIQEDNRLSELIETIKKRQKQIGKTKIRVTTLEEREKMSEVNKN